MPRVAHSISSAKLGMRCEHAWARRYIDHERPREVTWAQIEAGEIEPVGTERSRALGTAVHAILERHARVIYALGAPGSVAPVSDNDWSSVPGMIAHAALPYLPDPSEAVGVGAEERIGRHIVPGAGPSGAPGPVLEIDGIRFAGYIDLIWSSRGAITVRDWKTTSGLGWALTPDELQSDPQAALYTIDASTRHGHDRVDLSWVYLRTRGRPAAAEVRAIQTADRASDVIGPIVETCRRLDLIQDSASAAHNPLACTDYGGRPGAIGCPYHPALGGTCTVQRTIAHIAAAQTAARIARQRTRPESTPDPDPVATPRRKDTQIMALSPQTLAKFNRAAPTTTPTTEPEPAPTETAPVDDTAAPETAPTETAPVVAPAAAAKSRGRTKAAAPATAGSIGAQIQAHAVQLARLEDQRSQLDAAIDAERAAIAALVAG